MRFDLAYFSIGQLDRLSFQDTVVHRLDPRAKVIATTLFILAVVSFPKYAVLPLAPFFLFPALTASLGDIPVGFLAKKVLVVSPFAIFMGIFNPVFDTARVAFGGIELAAGWVSFLSILVKFSLTISAALLLVATTSFPGICHALRRIGLPSLFVSQLLFLYRYLFVLMEETMRMVRARDMRSFGGRGAGPGAASRLIGALFLRTVERAERIYGAMLSRGFRGDIPLLRHERMAAAEAVYLALCAAGFAVLRFAPVTEAVGRAIEGITR